MRKLAVDYLDKIAGDAACSLLLHGLRDTPPNVVSACAEALGNRRDLRIVPALTAQLISGKDIWVAFCHDKFTSCEAQLPTLLETE